MRKIKTTKKRPFDCRLSLRISPEMRDRLHEAAQRMHLQMADFVRSASLREADEVLGIKD